MSANLAEFLKVLTIVVTWSTCILAGRHYMLSIDDSREEEKDLIEQKEEQEVAQNRLAGWWNWYTQQT